MAVDFSRAKLELNADSPAYTIDIVNMGLNDNAFYNDSHTIVNTNAAYQVLSRTLSKVSILYTGKFITHGTWFYMGLGTPSWLKVSNISFSAGDTYSFQIDLDVSIVRN